MNKYQKFINTIGKKYLATGQLKLNEPLSLHTTFKMGGPAKVFFKADNIEELIKAIKTCQKIGLDYFILGQGSNVLVGDLGFNGMVIKNGARQIKILGYRGEIRNQKSEIRNTFLEVEGGVLVNRLIRFTLDKGIGGLENFLGLPGTVGGAVYTNAHNLKANDFFGEHLFEIHLLTPSGKIKKVTKDYFNFGYDQSKIQQTKEIVLSVIFSFQLGEKRKLWQKANQTMAYRIESQPLGKASAGCIFKNIKQSEALRIPTPGRTTSAGFLISAAGLKGKKIGGAQVSPLHANFIINTGQANAKDVVKLIKVIKKKVKEKFGVRLEEEIQMIGEF